MLELVDSFHLGWNGISAVQVQVLLSIHKAHRKPSEPRQPQVAGSFMCEILNQANLT